MATKGEKEMPEDNEELVDESKSSDDASGGNVTFWDSKLTQVKAVRDIQLRDDERVPSITGMCMLDNEEIVLCDNANNKVKFLNNISTTV